MNLDKSVKTRKSMQALDAPSKIKKNLITNKVTATFLISLCTSIAYMTFPRLTDLSRMNGHSLQKRYNAVVGRCVGALWVSLSAHLDCVAAFAKGATISCKRRLARYADSLTELGNIILKDY